MRNYVIFWSFPTLVIGFYFIWLWHSFEQDTGVPILAAVTDDIYLLKPKILALQYMEMTDYRLATKPIRLEMPTFAFLLAGYADASLENRKTILFLASKFLEHGAQIDEYHMSGTPLHLSVMDGEPELVAYLLDQGADPLLRIVAQRKGRFDGMNAFEIAEYLRDQGSRKHSQVLQILRSSQDH